MFRVWTWISIKGKQSHRIIQEMHEFTSTHSIDLISNRDEHSNLYKSYIAVILFARVSIASQTFMYCSLLAL